MARKKKRPGIVEKLKAALTAAHEEIKRLGSQIPTAEKPEEVNAGATGQVGLLVGDISKAYAIIKAPPHGAVPSFILLKLKIEQDHIVGVEKGVENLLGVIASNIEEDIMEHV